MVKTLLKDPLPVRQEVQLILDQELQWLCATKQIEQTYLEEPCPNSRANRIHELIYHRIASRFEKQDVELIVFPGATACCFWLQVNKIKGKLEFPAFGEIPVSARRNLERAGVL